jgi:hypothetical protein
MPTLRHHTPEDYERLPHIDARGTGVLSPNDRACLDALGAALVRAGAERRFGATLLHRHFAVAPGEWMVETVDASRAYLTLRPSRAPQGDLVATHFRFDADGSLVALEYAENGRAQGYAPLGEGDEDVLNAARNVLAGHHKIGRFGLRFLHEPLDVGADEIRLENCDEDARVLTCSGVARDDLAATRSITTVFCWQAVVDDARGLVAAQECKQVCRPWQQCHAPTGTHQTVSGHNTSHGG